MRRNKYTDDFDKFINDFTLVNKKSDHCVNKGFGLLFNSNSPLSIHSYYEDGMPYSIGLFFRNYQLSSSLFITGYMDNEGNKGKYVNVLYVNESNSQNLIFMDNFDNDVTLDVIFKTIYNFTNNYQSFYFTSMEESKLIYVEKHGYDVNYEKVYNVRFDYYSSSYNTKIHSRIIKFLESLYQLQQNTYISSICDWYETLDSVNNRNSNSTLPKALVVKNNNNEIFMILIYRNQVTAKLPIENWNTIYEYELFRIYMYDTYVVLSYYDKTFNIYRDTEFANKFKVEMITNNMTQLYNIMIRQHIISLIKKYIILETSNHKRTKFVQNLGNILSMYTVFNLEFLIRDNFSACHNGLFSYLTRYKSWIPDYDNIIITLNKSNPLSGCWKYDTLCNELPTINLNIAMVLTNEGGYMTQNAINIVIEDIENYVKDLDNATLVKLAENCIEIE